MLGLGFKYKIDVWVFDCSEGHVGKHMNKLCRQQGLQGQPVKGI